MEGSLMRTQIHQLWHLIAFERQQAEGIINKHDYQMKTGSSPAELLRNIATAATVADIVDQRPHIDHVMKLVMCCNSAAKPMMAFIAELNDRVVDQLIRFIENDMASEGLGPPPAPYCWLVMGSQGRQEQTLCTDQDNALLYADIPAKRAPEVKAWFLELARRVVNALERFGIPKCQGGIMASNPKWCLSVSEWCKTFNDYIDDPTPENLRLATIFFDFRGVTTDFDGAGILRRELTRMASGRIYFARVLSKNALRNRPPLGFLNRFVLEKSEKHNRGLNLKLRGLTPVVDAARVLALELGVASANTLVRLSAAVQKKILRPDFFAATCDAYDYINAIRVKHHLEAIYQGKRMNNFVDPAVLNPMERKVLKECFVIIGKLQELMSIRYRCRLVGEG